MLSSVNKIVSPLKISYQDPTIQQALLESLTFELQKKQVSQEIVIVCIGTDRSTGDSLGPLIGSELQHASSSLFHLYGTLDHPVHAMNLQQTLDEIHQTFNNPFIIGIDACLGQSTSVGFIQVAPGPVRPGAGVNKKLPPVGHMHLTGIVNVGGFMEYMVLQNTRLNLVVKMAKVMSQALLQAISAQSSDLVLEQ